MYAATMARKLHQPLQQPYQLSPSLPLHLSQLSVDDLPDAQTQREINKTLKSDKNDPTDIRDYRYIVSSNWYSLWRRYIGEADNKLPGQTAPPGPIRQEKDNNMNILLEGHQWRVLKDWYGCAAGYQYDREKKVIGTFSEEFEIAHVNELLGMVEHHKKWFDRNEKVGYVEFQMRRILGIPRSAQTRLWYTSRVDGLKSQREVLFKRNEHILAAPLFDRNAVLLDTTIQFKEDTSYILALELRDMNGLWPSGTPEKELIGDLEYYYMLTEGYQPKDVTVDSLSTYIQDVKPSEVPGAIENMVTKTNLVLSKKLKETQTLHSEAKELAAHYNTSIEQFKSQIKEFNEERDKFLLEKAEFEKEKAKFAEEKEEFDATVEIIKKRNTETETMVSLNVGGYEYQTSVATLTSDPDSMLAQMFSGKYPLKTLKDDSYFIDADGELFHYILDFLRKGDIDKMSFPDKIDRYNAILDEMDYFQIKCAKTIKDQQHELEERLNAFGFSDDFFLDDCGIFD